MLLVENVIGIICKVEELENVLLSRNNQILRGNSDSTGKTYDF